MGFESHGGESWYGRSPGGFEFGVQGWQWGPPVPKSITFFLDGSCVVCDQYGRQIRRAVLADGRELRFADGPPDGSREGAVVPRPQYASHAATIAALAAEGINWQAFELRWRDKTGAPKHRGGMTQAEAASMQARLIGEGCAPVIVDRAISAAGWPQLPYDELKKLAELPPTPLAELKKILDTNLRRDALRMRREADEAREKEMAGAEAE